MRGDSSQHGELRDVLGQDDALGHIYQAINAPALEAAYRATARDRRKFTTAEIPAVTQLFTPKWVVEFLLHNTLGKLWIEEHPESSLAHKWNWLVKPTQPRESNPIQPQDIRICDPACGTMNFGLVAIDMLRDIYRQANHRGDIDSSIVRNNLVGFDIDPTAIDLARRSLEIKIGRTIAKTEHRLHLRDALFEKWDGELFDVVVTNPPYLSARNLEPKVVRRLKARYPTAWRDLYACFLLRAIELLKPGGLAGILSMHSFMFTAAFERMRRQLHDLASVEVVAHFGPGLFDVGNPGTLQTAAIVLRKRPAKLTPAVFFRLVEVDDKRAALSQFLNPSDIRLASRDCPDHLKVSGFVRFCQVRHELNPQELAASPRAAWMYWISPGMRRAFLDLPKLGDVAPPRQGLATTDNARFVRYWWEVEKPGFRGERPKWKPYAKGGRFRRWYEAARHRVNWENDGAEIKAAIVERYPYLNGQWQWVAKNTSWYGREGITYSYLTSGSFSARKLDAGTIFDVAGSSLFPEDGLAMLGVLNSLCCGEFLAAINPTVNFQVGDLRQLPVPRSFPEELRREVAAVIEHTRRLDTFDETSVDFARPELWDGSETKDLPDAIARSEEKIDRIVAELYGMDAGEKPRKMDREHAEWKVDLARRWISYALGIWLGRWGNSKVGEVAALSPLDRKLEKDLGRILDELAGENAARMIIAEVAGLERFFARDFFAWHHRLYRGRPVIWGFSSGEKLVAVSSLDADERLMREAFETIGQALPRGWRRWADDGIRINLAPLRQWIGDRKLRNSLQEVDTDLRHGRLRFSQTSLWLEKLT